MNNWKKKLAHQPRKVRSMTKEEIETRFNELFMAQAKLAYQLSAPQAELTHIQTEMRTLSGQLQQMLDAEKENAPEKVEEIK